MTGSSPTIGSAPRIRMTVLLFLLVFVLCSQVLAFAIALIARSWVWKTEPSRPARHRRGACTRRGCRSYGERNDTRFGFPTGIFRIEESQSTTSRLVARELDFSGSRALDLGRFAIAIPAAFVAAAADEGCVAGFFALAIGVTIAMFLAVPLLVIGLVEVVLRRLMRSCVVAVIEPTGSDGDACAVGFELAGLSAFGLRRSLVSGLAAPSLPPQWAARYRSEPTSPGSRTGSTSSTRAGRQSHRSPQSS